MTHHQHMQTLPRKECSQLMIDRTHRCGYRPWKHGGAPDDVWSAAADQRCRAETESVREPTPAVHHKAPLMALNWTWYVNVLQPTTQTGSKEVYWSRLDHTTFAIVGAVCHGQRCQRMQTGQEASASPDRQNPLPESKVSENFKYCHHRRVVGPVCRLRVRQQIVVLEIFHKLLWDHPLQQLENYQ